MTGHPTFTMKACQPKWTFDRVAQRFADAFSLEAGALIFLLDGERVQMDRLMRDLRLEAEEEEFVIDAFHEQIGG